MDCDWGTFLAGFAIGFTVSNVAATILIVVAALTHSR